MTFHAREITVNYILSHDIVIFIQSFQVILIGFAFKYADMYYNKYISWFRTDPTMDVLS